KQFEFLVLESAQAGLSWSTILKKREGYREAFAGFDVQQLARCDEPKHRQQLNSPPISPSELTIRSANNTSQRLTAIQNEVGSFDTYIWSFVDGQPIQNNWQSLDEVPATTPLSDRFSKDLKKRGFKFVGSTTMYAHLQATGIVNDHLTSCFRHAEIAALASQ